MKNFTTYIFFSLFVTSGILWTTKSLHSQNTLPSGRTEKNRMDSILAIKPETGEILLEYDKNNFLNKDFPTGSLIKIFTIIAALNQDTTFKNLEVTCKPSSYSVSSFNACWHRPGHGKLNMTQAIAHSCNRYLRILGEKINPDEFWKVLVNYGLIDLSDVKTYKNWSKREIVEAMVGTGAKLKIPPKKFLFAYSALFNGGYLYYEKKLSETNPQISLRVRYVKQNPFILKAIREGMQKCCVYGSGTNAQVSVKGNSVAGKTGTAAYYYHSKSNRRKTHGLFIGFLPAGGKPKIGLIVFSLEGKGSKSADIAGDILYVLSLINQ